MLQGRRRAPARAPRWSQRASRPQLADGGRGRWPRTCRTARISSCGAQARGASPAATIQLGSPLFGPPLARELFEPGGVRIEQRRSRAIEMPSATIILRRAMLAFSSAGSAGWPASSRRSDAADDDGGDGRKEGLTGDEPGEHRSASRRWSFGGLLCRSLAARAERPRARGRMATAWIAAWEQATHLRKPPTLVDHGLIAVTPAREARGR
jgi:hypothetical protein